MYNGCMYMYDVCVYYIYNVCVYMYMYIYMYMYNVCVCVYMYAYICTCMYVCIYIYIHVYVHVFMCKYSVIIYQIHFLIAIRQAISKALVAYYQKCELN